jgi:hypothetical protein
MGCGCLVFLASAISPRLGVFLLWFFTDRMTQAFESGWVALLGFLLLPWTTLAWAVAYQVPAGVDGFGWFIVGLGLLVDLSTLAGSGRARSSR